MHLGYVETCLDGLALPSAELHLWTRRVFSGVSLLLKIEVGIRKRVWQRAWRYPAYIWSLRWVYAVKNPRRLVYAVYPRIPPPIHHCVYSNKGVHMARVPARGTPVRFGSCAVNKPLHVTVLSRSISCACSPNFTRTRAHYNQHTALARSSDFWGFPTSQFTQRETEAKKYRTQHFFYNKS